MNYINYKGKICVVTGAASGIGYATAKLLLEEGAIVYALDKQDVYLPLMSIPCDLADKESIDSAFLTIPEHIDCFFGVAGLSGLNQDYYTTFTVNFIANKYITDEYLKYRMNPKGSIVYVSSTAGNYWEKYSSEFKPFIKANTWVKMIDTLHKKIDKDTLGVMAYPLSKRALNYYMAEKAIEFANQNVRVNALLPSATDTDMFHESSKDFILDDELITSTGPGDRVATAEEIAKTLLFLNSDMASFISGQCIIADNGNDAMIKTSKKRDRLDMKVGSKLFMMGFVQNQIKKQIDPPKPKEDKKTPVEDMEIL